MAAQPRADLKIQQEYTIDKTQCKTEELGICLIFSNIDFIDKESFKTRNGGEIDERLLEETFVEVGFKVVCHRNKTHEEMMMILQKAVVQDISPEHSTFVLCLLSHGTLFKVFGVDGQPLDIWDDLIHGFTGVQCPALRGKPKLVIAQCCQGSQKLPAVAYMDGDSTTSAHNVQYKTDPHLSDILLALGAPPYYISLRNPKSGSPFVKIFCEQLLANYKNCDLYKIFLKVKTLTKDIEGKIQVNETTKEVVKIQPTIVDTLHKLFYLRQTPEPETEKIDETEVDQEESTNYEISFLPGCVEACYLSNDQVVLAAFEDKTRRISEHLSVILFTRYKNNYWRSRTICVALDTNSNMKHLSGSYMAKVSALMAQGMIVEVHHTSSGLTDLHMVSTKQQEHEKSIRPSALHLNLSINGSTHVDTCRAVIWAPDSKQGIIRRLQLPDLELMSEWRHHCVHCPSSVSTGVQLLAVEDSTHTTVSVLTRSPPSKLIYLVPYGNCLHSMTLLSDDSLLLFEVQHNRMSLWTAESVSQGQQQPHQQAAAPFLLTEHVTRRRDDLQLHQIHADTARNIVVLEKAEQVTTGQTVTAIYSVDVVLDRLRNRDRRQMAFSDSKLFTTSIIELE